jgi:hypothetical protein
MGCNSKVSDNPSLSALLLAFYTTFKMKIRSSEMSGLILTNRFITQKTLPFIVTAARL